jgi:hypothetical protein
MATQHDANATVLLITSILSFIGSSMLVLCCVKYSRGTGVSEETKNAILQVDYSKNY